MTTPPLFDPPAPASPAPEQKCDTCPLTLAATIDSLRVRGWVAYNGTSFTGKQLTVRLCPDCRRGV